MRQQDLFRYPHAAGYKEHTTSKEAARKIEPRAPTLRMRAVAVLGVRPMTADEIAAELGESILAVRPRITELFKLNKIEWTGEYRANKSGMRAHVWRLPA